MSIKFICNDKTIFEIPYHIWLDIKSHIITSTFEYLLDNFEINKQKYSYITDINHPNYIGQYSSYYGEMMDLQYVNNEIIPVIGIANPTTIETPIVPPDEANVETNKAIDEKINPNNSDKAISIPIVFDKNSLAIM